MQAGLLWLSEKISTPKITVIVVRNFYICRNIKYLKSEKNYNYCITGIFYGHYILRICHFGNFMGFYACFFLLGNEWPMNEYQTKHLLNMSHNVIIEALKHT